MLTATVRTSEQKGRTGQHSDAAFPPVILYCKLEKQVTWIETVIIKMYV
jgi:hypothetical protein